MTEYEFHDYMISVQMAGGQAAMDVVAVFFAYVGCTYLVGAKLTRFQAIALSTVYTAFLFMPTFALRGILLRAQEVVARHPEFGYDMVFAGVVSTLMPAVLLSAWLLSLIYMATIRRTRVATA